MIALILFVVLAAYVAVAIIALRAVKTRKSKAIVAAVLILIPFGDVIVGGTYFHYLCATEGGIKVHTVVELRPEYWNTDGTPRFIKKDGDLDEAILGGRYIYKRESNPNYTWFVRIDRKRRLVINRETGQVIGEHVSFLYWGGWLINSTGLQVTATSCDSVKTSLYQDFLQHVFKR